MVLPGWSRFGPPDAGFVGLVIESLSFSLARSARWVSLSGQSRVCELWIASVADRRRTRRPGPERPEEPENPVATRH